MKLTDTHCHLYLDEFKNDLHEIIQRARSAGVERFCMPSIDSSIIKDMLEVEALFKGECFPMMGLHPCSVKENYLGELKIVEEYLSQRSFIALGEIGFDFYWDTTFINEQHEAFRKQMDWALQYNIPIVIHTRNAMQQTIDALKPYAAKGLGGIFHCFGDSYDFAKQIIDMNFLLGVGGVVTYKNAGLAQVLDKIDMKHLVLETDAPYLAPVPYRGKRNESSYLKIIAEKIAAIKNISVEEVAVITTENAERIFKF